MAALLGVLLAAFAVCGINGQGTPPNPFNGTNPLIPNRAFNYRVALTYRSANTDIGPFCNRVIPVQGSTKRVDVAASPVVSAREVRVPPEIEITGPATTALFTLIMAVQEEYDTSLATPTKPFVTWVRSDLSPGPQGGIGLSRFLPILAPAGHPDIVFVGLYQQPGPINVNASVAAYTNGDCPAPAGRCQFDIETFVADTGLSLQFAGHFIAMPDHYSVASVAELPFVQNGCFWLDKFDMTSNVLIGEKALDFNLGVMAKFVTPPLMMDAMCGRAFHFKEDKVEVTARTGKPVPSRKTRAIPWVWYHRMDDDESWKEDWYTLAYVSQLTDWPEGGNPEKPLLLWLVTNIHGGDVSGGNCNVPYIQPLPISSVEVAFLLFKQEGKVEINAADFSESACSLQYRCSFNVKKMAAANKLTMVGAQTFTVAADPYSVISVHKEGYITEAQACQALIPFREEGKMLGQCMPKFSSWKDLWEKMMKSEDEEEKKGMMEQMSDMCPELEKDFSKDEPYDKDEKKDDMGDKKEEMKDGMDDKVKKYLEEKMKKAAEEKKYFMHMLMKKMFGEKMDKMDDDEDKDDKKDCAKEMMGMMMKMKEGMDMMKGNWDDKEKEMGPCMKAVAMKLKELHEEYISKQKMQYMKEKFEMYMKEHMQGFVKHMMMKKMADHLGIKCEKEEGEDNPCDDPKEVKMLLWKKYVTMKEKKQGMDEDKKYSMEKDKSEEDEDWGDKEKMMEYMKKQMKEILFFKSIMTMIKEKHEQKKEEMKGGDAMPALKEFVKNHPGWKRFCDDL